MKILHLISQHPDSTGSGFYLQNIIRQSAAAGNHNILVAGVTDRMTPDLDGLDPRDGHFVRFEQRPLDFRIPGMSDVMPYPSTRFSALNTSQLERYRRCFSDQITQAVTATRPDLIHSHHLWLVSGFARDLFPDLPLITSCHSTDLRQASLCPGLGKLVSPLCRKIDRVLALSRDQQERITRLHQIPEEKITVVGGGFCRECFSWQAKAATPPVHLLYAGKLSLAKGVDCLLRAFRALDDDRLHLHLAGSGSGDEQRQCLELAAACGPSVTVHGRLDQRELAELMGRCHIFILPSFFEGLPLVLLEALTCGCRIITTDLSGCRELLETAPADLASFVPLPKLEHIDRPAEADLPHFENQLQSAIRAMAERAEQAPSTDVDQVDSLTAPYGWDQVFGRIAAAYRTVLDR